jgi:hypothetical protein
MKTSITFTKVVEALHGVQQDLEIIARDDKVKVKTTKGEYSYKFTGYPTIWLAVKPLLKKYDLTVVQTPCSHYEGSMGDYLVTTIFHTSGEWIADAMRLVITRDDPQGFGSAVTFARRYALSSMLGVVTDDDNDATTQRQADGDMKKEWVRAYTVMSKLVDPDHSPTNNDFMTFMTETYGKHPSKILAKEHQQVLDVINAFNPND